MLNKIAYSCFYLGVITEVLIVLIDKSAYINPIEGRLFQITFLLFLMKVCLTKYTPGEYAVIFLFCVLGAVSYFVTDRNEVVRVVIFLAACKDIDMKKCLKLVFYMTLVGCGIIILLSVTGIYGAVSLTQDYGRGSVETRYTLGMGHPNALQCMVWALTTLGLYLFAERMKWLHYLLVLAVNLFFFLLTDSKTAFLVTVLVIVLTGLLINRKSKIIAGLCAASGILLTVASVTGSVFIAANAYRIYLHIWHYNNEPLTRFILKLNDFFNGRIRILVQTDTFEGTIQTWRLFGKPCERYFDMGWIRLFYWYGILPGIVFVAVMLLMMIYCCRKKDYLALMMITSFAVYSIIEAHAVSVYIARNYVLFLIGKYWYVMLGDFKRAVSARVLPKKSD